MKVQNNTTMETVTQAEAARLRNISRERIRQLKEAGRFSKVVGADGKVIDHLLYKKDVIGLVRGKPGAPRLSKEELAKRKAADLETGDRVIYVRTQKGNGGAQSLPATVLKVGRKRVHISYQEPPVADVVSRGAFVQTAWVKPEALSLAPASRVR